MMSIRIYSQDESLVRPNWAFPDSEISRQIRRFQAILDSYGSGVGGQSGAAWLVCDAIVSTEALLKKLKRAAKECRVLSPLDIDPSLIPDTPDECACHPIRAEWHQYGRLYEGVRRPQAATESPDVTLPE